jgi:hypothetical protein
LLTATLLGVLAAGTLGYGWLARSYSPEGAVREYLTARDRGDVEAVWAAITIDSQLAKTDGSLVDKRALRATLSNPANRHSYPGWTVNQSRTSGDVTTVDISYRDAAAVRHFRLRVLPDARHRQLGMFPRWQVVLVPSAIAVAVPSGAGALTLDGLPMELAQARVQSIAIFPGSHHLELGASALFMSSGVDFQALQLVPTVTRIDFPLKLTEPARTAAGGALKDAFTACTAVTTLAAKGCPQGVIDTTSGPVRWKLIGEPADGANYVVSEMGAIAAQGHYQMEASYQGSNRPQHKAVGGGYKADLTWDGQKFSLPTLEASNSVPAASRPAIDDAAIKDLIKNVFDRCAASTSPSPPDCPQAAYVLAEPNGLTWKSNSDPMAGATVSFDGARSMFLVTGTYSMTAAWQETYPYDPIPHRRDYTASGRYQADLFWDGSKPVFISFEAPA